MHVNYGGAMDSDIETEKVSITINLSFNYIPFDK